MTKKAALIFFLTTFSISSGLNAGPFAGLARVVHLGLRRMYSTLPQITNFLKISEDQIQALPSDFEHAFRVSLRRMKDINPIAIHLTPLDACRVLHEVITNLSPEKYSELVQLGMLYKDADKKTIEKIDEQAKIWFKNLSESDFIDNDDDSTKKYKGY